MRAVAGALAAGLALGVAGCGPPGPMTLDGVTILRHKFTAESPAALLDNATIVFRDGCVGTDVLPSGQFEPIIWPPTAVLSHEGDELVLLVDGLVIHRLDAADVAGGEVNDPAFVEQLSGPIPEACRAELYWLAGEVSRPQSNAFGRVWGLATASFDSARRASAKRPLRIRDVDGKA